MNTLTSFSKSDSFLTTKISLLTFYGIRYPHWSEKVLILLEYLQLVSQSLLIYPNAVDPSSSLNSDFTKATLYFFKLVNPSSLMTFHSDDSLTNTILLIILSSMLLKYLLTAYVVYIAYRNQQGNTWLLSIWRWIFRRQSRILYFLISSFWTYLILNCSTGSFTIKGMNQSAIIAISSILISIEYIFSVILELRFSYMLPTKNFLSSKSYRTVIMTLSQKLVLQAVQLVFQGHFRRCLWIFTILTLTFNLIRTFHYYITLPLYNIKALLFQGDLLSIVTSLNIACLFHNILQDANYQEENVNFIIIVWLLISILAGKLSRDYILRQINNLLTRPSTGPVEKLLHKVFAMKQLKKSLKFPHKKSEKYETTYLIGTTGGANIQNVFNLGSKSSNKPIPELIANENSNETYLQYLEHLAIKSPHKLLIELHIAKLCSKDPEQYPRAINIISRLVHKKWSDCFLSASLLRYEIEKTVMKSHSNNETTLDLLAYIKNQIHVDKLTNDILAQIDLKITICNNILGEKSNIGLIFNNAQLIDRYKLRILKQIDHLSQTIPSCFIEPHLICAGYHLTLNDSIEGYVKYNDLYLQKQYKYERAFTEVKLNNENLYQDTNVFLIICGEKNTKGKIVYCSQSIENVCGRKQISYNRTHISTLFTPSFQPFYSEAIRQIFEDGKEMSLNQGKEVFLRHKNGHMIHAELFVKIHPYLTQGLYLDILIRPIPSTKEYLILTEDGTIESATKNLAFDLGIKNSVLSSSNHPNIRLISEELWVANQAFNTIRKTQNDQRLVEQGDSPKRRQSDIRGSVGYKKALSLHKNFSDTQRIQLRSLRQSSAESDNIEEINRYLYDCSMSALPIGPALAKLITFDKVYSDDDAYESIDIQRHKDEHAAWDLIEEDQRKDIDESANADLSESENIESPEILSDERPVIIYRPETNLNTNTNENLLSPTSRQQTDRPFLLTSGEEENNINSPTSRANKNRLLWILPPQRAQKVPEAQMNPLSSNQPNPSSQNKTASTTFKTAIAINFRPRSFTAICLMFYAVILITLLSQVVLKIVSDDVMTTLAVKKNILTYSQLRLYRVFLISTSCRVGVTTLTATNLDYGLVWDLPTTLVYLKNQSDFLTNCNNKILEYASFLDEDVQHQLFVQDVEVFDYQMNNLSSSPSRYVSQFEVIDETVDKIYKLNHISDLNSGEALGLFYSLRYNFLNDFLYKCEQITNLLTESVQDEREYLELIIALFLIIIPCLLMGIILMVTGIIWKQYQIEKRNMLAFIRLKPNAVKEILVKLKSFKKDLQNKDYREYQKPIEADEESQGLPQDELQRNTSIYKRQDGQVINYNDMRTRYYGYFVKVTFYVAVLIGIMIWNFISAEKANKVIYNKQNQIHFANSMIEVVGVEYMALEDAFQTNNTAIIKHSTDPLALMIDQLEKLKSMQSQIPEVFLEVDRTYDPQVQSQLFESYCSQFTFTASITYFYCNLILSIGQRVNLVSLLTLFQDIMQGELQDYPSCDNSSLNSMYKCLYKNINTFMPPWVLLMGELFSIGDTISPKLEQSIADANHQRNVFLIVFSISLIVASLLIWYEILGKLKEGYNDFKKVLQLFPPALILSSFQLKTFLLQHSKQIRT